MSTATFPVQSPIEPALRPYQVAPARAIVESVRNKRGLTFSVVMARQAGKNELSAHIEMMLLIQNAARALDGIKCAPTFNPQARISMFRLWSLLGKTGFVSSADREDGRSIRVARARMVFLSAEANANVVGHTAGLVLEVDEAQDVDADKFDREFRPMAAPHGATVVYYGTPWDGSTLLERAAQHHIELQRRDGIQRHFEADWQTVAESSPGYARYVESERQRLGEGHPLFLTQYALRPIPGAGRMFSAAQRAQLQGSHARQYARRAGETYVAGLDIGGQAGDGSGEHDATVLTIARVCEPPADAVLQEPRVEVVEHLAVTGVPHDELLMRLTDVLRNVWAANRVAVDATGIGETISRLLARALGEGFVRPMKFTAESKSKLGFDLLAAVNGGRLKVYAADGSMEYAEFWRQIEAARTALRPSGRMTFRVDPAEGHDDYLVSLALVVSAGGEGIEKPRIARGRTRMLSGWYSN